jgi:serine protease inhibitor
MTIKAVSFEKSLARELEAKTNVIVSPYSIAQTLSLLALGSEGKTKEEICFIANQPYQIQALSDLKCSTALWIDERLSLNPEYIADVKTRSNTEIGAIDISDCEAARKKINSYVAEKTGQKIQNLLHFNEINPRTRLVLTNTIYFQGNWRYPFNPTETEEEFFYGEKTTKKTAMMHLHKQLPYYETKECQLLTLPFFNDEIELLLLLPKNEDQALLEVDFLPLLDRREVCDIALTLPRFQLEMRLSLKEILQKMGMRLPFTEQADFSKISQTPLFISNIITQATLTLDEKGVIASAATGGIMGITSIFLPKEDPIAFVANHPFFFFLIDKQTHALLFMGKVGEL